MASFKFIIVHLIVQIIVFIVLSKIPYIGRNCVYILLLSSLVNIAYPYDNNNDLVNFMKWPMIQLRKLSSWVCSKI